VDDDLMTGHRFGHQIELTDIAADDAQPSIPQMIRDMPLPPRCEVVVQRNRRYFRIGQQMIGEVTANESSSTNDKKTVAKIGPSK
jgi:hypothetical protein